MLTGEVLQQGCVYKLSTVPILSIQEPSTNKPQTSHDVKATMFLYKLY